MKCNIDEELKKREPTILSETLEVGDWMQVSKNNGRHLYGIAEFQWKKNTKYYIGKQLDHR